MVVILLLLKIPDRDTTKLPIKEKLAQLDVYGTAMILPGCVCLILALQWGGLTYLVGHEPWMIFVANKVDISLAQWNDGRIIALLVLAGVLLLGFILVQVFLPKTATIPPRIFKQRSIIAGVFVATCIGSQQVIFSMYL